MKTRGAERACLSQGNELPPLPYTIILLTVKILHDLISTIVPYFVWFWYIRSCKIYAIKSSNHDLKAGGLIENQGKLKKENPAGAPPNGQHRPEPAVLAAPSPAGLYPRDSIYSFCHIESLYPILWA